MRFVCVVTAAALFLILGFIPVISFAKCGVGSFSVERCGGGGERRVVQCADGIRRILGQPNACFAGRRYSVGRVSSVTGGFCENRCSPSILDCAEAPSLDHLMRAICERAVTCRPDLFTGPYTCAKGEDCALFSNQVRDCVIRLDSISVSDELGLAEDPAITFAVIRDSLAARTVKFDPDVYCDCIHRIRIGTSCEAVSSPLIPFGESLFENLIPHQCGQDWYPGTLLPDGLNPVTGEVVED